MEAFKARPFAVCVLRLCVCVWDGGGGGAQHAEVGFQDGEKDNDKTETRKEANNFHCLARVLGSGPLCTLTFVTVLWKNWHRFY